MAEGEIDSPRVTEISSPAANEIRSALFEPREIYCFYLFHD